LKGYEDMKQWMIGMLRPRPWKTLPLLLLAAVVAYQGTGSLAGAAAQEPLDKVEPALAERVASGGEATFFVVMHEEANLLPAYGLLNRTARGTFVYQTLNEVAARSQADLRALLDARGVRYQPFWILNAIRVKAGEALMLEIAARPDVKSIHAEKVYQIPVPQPGMQEDRVNGIEWGVDRIRAPLVWTTFNVRGENTVVANIDTGVQYNHPALVNQYRGNLGGGNFNHNYNWHDPSKICGNPSLVPCDNNSHGTHTMGTMVGDDGGANQIGVAPRAKWIAAKGCESGNCSENALLSSAQWILAPTDLNGLNPRPDLRPHVVNNSWGGGGGDPWYSPSVNAWVASGIFPAFAAGNEGSGCRTLRSPGDYVESYTAGSFDINNNISGFSSRGPSSFGPNEIKPNLAAPGSNVRSSVPVNGYANFNGTSMATPHMAATVALIWSRTPALIGNIAATRQLLDDGAVDVANSQCGGTTDDNNVWGEGRLDAFASVSGSQKPPSWQR
jgi:subtilisin family serine protease